MTSPALHLTVDERIAAGRAARKAVPREAHAEWAAPADRPDPVALLESQAATRVPELVPIRYGRMLVTPFTFYRGAALIMASDLSTTPESGLRVQLCGDAHLSNFGLFGSPERRLLFDLNDFDETAPGPWEWDVKRLVASLEVAGRSIGATRKERRRITRATAAGYRTAMRDFAGRRNLEVFYTHLDAADLLRDLSGELTKQMRKRLEATLTKAMTADSTKALRKLTRLVDGERRIISDPPLIEPLGELIAPDQADAVQDAIATALRGYRSSLHPDRRMALEQFRLIELARKVVGVGSVGTRAWIGLMLGRDADDPLFLQFKEAEASVLEAFTGASQEPTHGDRVVAGQRLMQAGSDIFLGSMQVDIPGEGVTRDFYVRQLKDWKGSFEAEGARPEGLAIYGQVCGWTLARAHARSGDRIAIAAYLGSGDTFDRALSTFGERYADQNEQDFAVLTAAVADGRLEARSGL